ncbi:hypothetical protein IJ732_04145 [bacterium]|nr:hypothetical protein [bacterium]
MDIFNNKSQVYEFSAPMPFDFDLIDELAQFNSTLKKSKIVTLFNNVPFCNDVDFNEWIQVLRGCSVEGIKTLKDFAKYVNYAQSRGFRFTYIMNSPKPMSTKDFYPFEERFDKLLNLLENIGCSEIKFANPQVAKLITEKKPDVFNFSSSTASEYHNISQYEYLTTIFPNIKMFNVSNDEIFNFKFLKNLRTKFPDKKIEIMVNEPCLRGCPARISHISSIKFYNFNCSALKRKLGILNAFFRSGFVYPWNLHYYSEMGINNFKFSAHPYLRSHFKIDKLKNYLNCVEKGIENISLYHFFNDIFAAYYSLGERYMRTPKDIMLKDVLPYLPNMEYFVKNGDKCSYNCGVDCNYCQECAKKLEKYFMSQQNIF